MVTVTFRPPLRELVLEHGTLLRRLAALQQRVSEQLTARERRVAELEGHALRLQAELVLLRTSVFWGLGAVAVQRRPPRRRTQTEMAAAPELRAAQAVICQTGCVGHAHPWREADGQCRLTGQTCEPASLRADSDAD